MHIFIVKCNTFYSFTYKTSNVTFVTDWRDQKLYRNYTEETYERTKYIFWRLNTFLAWVMDTKCFGRRNRIIFSSQLSVTDARTSRYFKTIKPAIYSNGRYRVAK